MTFKTNQNYDTRGRFSVAGSVPPKKKDGRLAELASQELARRGVQMVSHVAEQHKAVGVSGLLHKDKTPKKGNSRFK